MNTNEPGAPEPAEPKGENPLPEEWLKPREPSREVENEEPGCMKIVGGIFVVLLVLFGLLLGTCLLTLR